MQLSLKIHTPAAESCSEAEAEGFSFDAFLIPRDKEGKVGLLKYFFKFSSLSVGSDTVKQIDVETLVPD